MKPVFFKSPADFRKWLEAHHTTVPELWVGFYKKGSGNPSMTWPESVDEALCFGWIDGIRKSVDEISYTIRFTPRRPTSIWSAVNIKRIQILIDQGLVRPAGLKAFEKRKENKAGIYSYENRPAELDDSYEKILKKNKAAWEFYRAQPPSRRKAINWWILSAKKEETRLNRINKLGEDSTQKHLISQLTRPKKPQ